MRRLLILFVAAGMAFAQDAPKPSAPPQREAEIIPVKTLSGDSFDRLVKLLDVFGAPYKADEQLRTILVYAPKDVVAQMRRVVEQLDRPGSEATFGRNIEMTLTLLRCSTKAPAATSVLPADMEPVAKQLRAATQYKDIQLWDVVPLRLQEGRDTQESLRLPGGIAQLSPATGQIRIHPEAVYRKDQARFVRFSRVDLGFRIPVPTGAFHTGGPADTAPLVQTQYTMVDVGLQTSGDFQEGQKTVLGKVSGVEEGDAIFAVIALKVLD
ncbi:MAG TPA: hypothetical protein VG297_09420 [Bryobacteraceae bacterium]|jgi:hypothetical protein|nr:hypothetical protein [Bryobacteraceae bacterium]